MQFRTRAIHAGNERDPQTGAVVPPIHMAATYVQPGAGEWGRFDYSRSGNPTRKSLETTLASLESGTWTSASGAEAPTEYQVKAVFVYNFSQGLTAGVSKNFINHKKATVPNTGN